MAWELNDARLACMANINMAAYVRLTEYGKRVYIESQFGPRDAMEALRLHTTPDGWTHFMLWDLMNRFGPCMWMGNNEMPFEDNVIRLEKTV